MPCYTWPIYHYIKCLARLGETNPIEDMRPFFYLIVLSAKKFMKPHVTILFKNLLENMTASQTHDFKCFGHIFQKKLAIKIT